MSAANDAASIVRAQACGQPRCPCNRADRRGYGLTHCPVHQDNTPSFNVSVRGDTLLYHCHGGGCSQQTVTQALREANLIEEATQHSWGDRIDLSYYDYRDERGHRLFQVIRTFPKGFRQRRPVGHDDWINNLEGVRRVLYMLPELLAADPGRTTVFIVEGEKDVERLQALGFVATCNPGGAGKWMAEYNDYFRGRSVVIIVDNDDAGRSHAMGVAHHLRGLPRVIKWLELPDLEQHGDVSDWLDDGGTRDELIRLARQAPTPPVIVGDNEGTASLLTTESVRIVLNGPSGPIDFTFTDMEKVGKRELEAEMSVHLLQPGTVDDAYTTRLNLLSGSGRDVIRREIVDVLGLPKDQTAKLLNRAYDQARRLFLGQDRTQRIRDIDAPTRLEYMVEQLLLEERPTILFGPGGSLKTYISMSVMLAIATGQSWLERTVKKRNCLLIDYETGDKTTGLRFRRLAQALGLDDIPDNIYLWHAAGVPLEDLVEPLKRTIDQHQIGFIGIDHCAAAAGSEPESSDAALRFYRALGKLKIPTLAIAHVTGDVASKPELARRPFGSIFWDNGAGLTWFLQKEEQGEGSPTATIGLFQKKWNDTGKLRDFSVMVTFDGDNGAIDIEKAELRNSRELAAARGQQWLVHHHLQGPMTVEALHDSTGIGPAMLRKILNKYTALFERVTDSGGHHPNLWIRKPGSDSVVGASGTTSSEPYLPYRESEGTDVGPLAPHTASVPEVQNYRTSGTEPDRENGHGSDLPW